MDIEKEFDRVQREQVAWVKRFFPDRSANYPLLGVVEECGELLEAIRIGGPDEFEDAIGDVIVYLADYATTQDWSLGSLWRDRDLLEFPTQPGSRLLRLLGTLAQAQIKSERGIRGTADEWYAKGRRASCLLLGELAWIVGEDDEVGRIVVDTWAKVSQRDWNKYPHDGLTR